MTGTPPAYDAEGAEGIAALLREHFGGWAVDLRLPGGWQQGAWLVTTDTGRKAVVKVHRDDTERVLAARHLIERARAAGWPTPSWVATGTTADGAVWVVQEHVDGRRPAVVDRRVAEHVLAAFEIQRGLGGGDGWGEWVAGVVFEDWEGFRARARHRVPLGDDIVALVDRIAAATRGTKVGEDDLVHGNADLVNAIDTGDRIWFVDAASIGPGPVAYDLAEVIMTTSTRPELLGDGNGVERLWQWGTQTLPVAEIAICAGSIALTCADAYVRLGHLEEAAAALPGVVATLRRAAKLVE